MTKITDSKHRHTHTDTHNLKEAVLTAFFAVTDDAKMTVSHKSSVYV